MVCLQKCETDRQRFGEDSVERMIMYLTEYLEMSSFRTPPYVLDLGTGNGHLLFALLEAKNQLSKGALDARKLCGIDYSQASIQLAKSIAAKRGADCSHVVFEEADLREMICVNILREKANEGHGWDIVCDKGTVSYT